MFGTAGCVSALHLGLSWHDMGAVALAEQPAMVVLAMSVMTSLRDISCG